MPTIEFKSNRVPDLKPYTTHERNVMNYWIDGALGLVEEVNPIKHWLRFKRRKRKDIYDFTVILDAIAEDRLDGLSTDQYRLALDHLCMNMNLGYGEHEYRVVARRIIKGIVRALNRDDSEL